MADCTWDIMELVTLYLDFLLNKKIQRSCSMSVHEVITRAEAEAAEKYHCIHGFNQRLAYLGPQYQ